MLMSGRWGFFVKELIRSSGLMSEVTPGKLVSKKEGTELGSFSRVAKCPDGRKSVQVNDPSWALLERYVFWDGMETHDAGDGDEHEVLSRPDVQMTR